MKDIAPSTELRKWFNHDPERWPEFKRRYTGELAQRAAELDRLRTLARRGTVTLVYSAHDEAHNDAVVLKGLLSVDPHIRLTSLHQRHGEPAHCGISGTVKLSPPSGDQMS